MLLDATPMAESVSQTQFSDALALANRIYGRFLLRDVRSHTAIRMFCGALAIVVREARRDPEAANALCKQRRVKGKRLEVRVARLIAGRRNQRKQDQIARWANAAAYVAQPPNGDAPPRDWRDAVRYIDRRGGIRRLSNLYGLRGGQDETTIDRAFMPMDATSFYDEPGETSTCEWFTPPYVFTALGCDFDLDPASPGRDVAPWIPARHHFTLHDDGLYRDWFGFVWLNPPFGRHVLPDWLAKFARHGNGIALVPERTSTAWWQDLARRADLILAMNKKIPFINVVGEHTSSFPIGTHLIGVGKTARAALIRAHREGLGVLLCPFDTQSGTPQPHLPHVSR